MKVLIVSPFPPDPAPEANHALHLSEHLAEAGLVVHVLCKKGSIPATQKNIVVHPVIDDWTWSDLPRLTACMKNCQPDVVLLLYLGWIYNFHPMITFLPTICRMVLPGVPCVTQFEAIDGIRRRSFSTRALHKAVALLPGGKDVHRSFGTLLRDSDRIIALSSPHKDALVKHYPAVGEKCVIIPPPPLIRFCSDDSATVRKEIREEIGARETDFVLIYWGYIYPGKGIETLLKAFRTVCARNANIRLVLVGGGLNLPDRPTDYFQTVQQLPQTLGIAERVTWTGHFNWDSDMGSRYLYAGDACVLPLDWGLTLNNSSLAAAGTHGIPVIGTELPVGRDEALEHGQNIYLCRPEDPEMLAEAIQLISENTEIRERLREGILRLSRDWHSWDAMTERLVMVLESSISCRKAHTYHRSKLHQSASGPVTDNTLGCQGKLSHECDGVHGGNQHLSSPVWSAENSADDVNAPLVSIIVAVYNVEKYLIHCLDSLVHQTLKDIEIIVVNDASTDKSFEIIQKYKSTFPNVRVVNCEYNKGLASVRNIGMRVAKGQYIGFLDGDDWADIRMCEVMFRCARDHNADVLIADVTVFYDDSKKFGSFFDYHIRQNLDPQLRTRPFKLSHEPRILLLEPVAWPKIYKRSFLRKHDLHFEEGMNSYEDMCFHFSVLLKADRISLIDEALFFYRQNRPGQISGRMDRRVFEVFAVFDKILQNLAAWSVSADIWALLVKVQLRQFDWLLKDRVQSHDKREFLASVATQLRKIPEIGFQKFNCQANLEESAKLLCMRRNWLQAYEKLARGRKPLSPLLYVLLQSPQKGLLKRIYRKNVGIYRQRLNSWFRSLAKKLSNSATLEEKLEAVSDCLKHQLYVINKLYSPWEEALVETCRIDGQVFFFSTPSRYSGLEEAVRQMADDYYLTHTAIFREGDTIVDIGAHVGVIAIYLAKRYPFVKVYAIEPDAANYACLTRNIELNGVANITAINKAVSGDGLRRTLYVDALNSAWATIDAQAASNGRLLQTAQVDTLTVEQLFQRYGIRHCRLLKVTAPGAVHEFLQGFTRSGCIDLLCGEVDLEDCSRPKLEMGSWRIARQHFWRTTERRADTNIYSWIHQIPTEIGLR
jgi:polysaccharide biosynthesis protein PslF